MPASAPSKWSDGCAAPAEPMATPVEIDETAALTTLVHYLRQVREQDGTPKYDVMARRSGVSAGSLSTAAKGHKLPSLRTTEAYLRACGGDVDEGRRLWEEVKQARRLRARQQVLFATRTATSPSELLDSVKALAVERMTLREFEQQLAATGASRSSLSELFNGQKSPDPRLLGRILAVCGLDPPEVGDLLAALAALTIPDGPASVHANGTFLVIRQELTTLQRGKGLFVDFDSVGAHLRRAAWRRPGDVSDVTADAVAERLYAAGGTLPEDLRIAALATLGALTRCRHESLGERITWLAAELDRAPRTARRRADLGLDALAEEILPFQDELTFGG